MKLRLFVVVLLLANLGVVAWHAGWLDGLVGLTWRTQREPTRVTEQIQPQAIAVLPPNAAALSASRASTAASGVGGAVNAGASAPGVGGGGAGASAPADGFIGPLAPSSGTSAAAGITASAASAVNGSAALCLEAGPFTPAQIAQAERALAGVPKASWRRVTTERPGTWAVAMGPYAPAAYKTKSAEVDRLRLRHDRVMQTADAQGPSLLVLSRAPTKVAAQESLNDLSRRGIRTGKVVLLVAPVTTHRLRVEGSDEAQLGKLSGKATGVEGRSFQACSVG